MAPHTPPFSMAYNQRRAYRDLRSSRKPLVGLIILMFIYILWSRPSSTLPPSLTSAKVAYPEPVPGVTSAVEKAAAPPLVPATVVKPSTPSSGKPRIVILTMVTHQHSYLFMSLKNKWQYTQKHGYDLQIDYETNNPKGPVWHKMVMVTTAVESGKYDWIWWLDFDTLITNMTVTVESIIAEELPKSATNKPDDVDMLLTADCFPLNAGSMIFRSSPRALKHIDSICKCGEKKEDQTEQDCLRDIIEEQKLVETGAVVMVPQHKLNAFPEEIRCWDKWDKGWENGAFLIHFAGAWAHVKGDDPTGQMMKKYEPYILYGKGDE